MRTLIADLLRSSLRSGVRHRASSGAVMLTLSLAVGGATAVLGLAGSVFRPLPYPQSERLVHIWAFWAGGSGNISFPDAAAIAERSRTLEATAAYQAYGSVALTGRTPPENLNPSFVTPAYFTLLGARPSLGRVFSEEEDRVGASSAVAVLSHGLWARSFDRDPHIVGRSIQLNGQPFEVVGVLSEGFADLGAVDGPMPDVFVPTALAGRLMGQPARTEPFRLYWALGRLKPGVSLEAASEDLASIARQMEQERPDSHRGYGLRVQSLSDRVRGGFVTPTLLLLASSLFTLVVAGANVTNLILLRLTDRRRDLALRSALGASSARLFAMVFAEALTLTGVGSAMGIVLGLLLSRLASTWISTYVSPLLDLSVDGAFLAIAAGLSASASVAIALLPALDAKRSDIMAALSLGARNSVGDGRPTYKTVMAAEVAFALLLMVAAGLTLRSYDRLTATPLGLDAHNLLTFRMDLTGPRYLEPSDRGRAVDAFLQRVREIPGVTSATVWGPSLLGSATWIVNVAPEGRPRDRPDAFTMLFRHSVNPGGLGALGIERVSGRDFLDSDTSEAPLVGIVSESAAREFWPNQDPVGRRLFRSAPGLPPITVVGVARDVRHRQRYSFQEVADEGYIGGLGPQRDIYLPYAQRANQGVTFAVRVGDKNEPGLAAGLRRAAAFVDPDLPLSDTAFLDERIADQERLPRALALLLAMSAVLSALLAATGIYGVVAHGVGRRVREIGLRVALGARRLDIIGLVMRQGLVPVVGGAGTGLVASIFMSRWVASVLFGAPAGDPFTLVLAALSLVLLALGAMIIPARRALSVDPGAALKAE